MTLITRNSELSENEDLHMMTIDKLWRSTNEQDWKAALENYWNFVRPENIKLERELDDLKLETIHNLDPISWYEFLHDKYFRWKYTAPNRFSTTTRQLKKYVELDQFDELFEIKKKLLSFDTSDIPSGLLIATRIRGLGIAGASGLLSLMYPDHFGTVDQFAVKAFCQIRDLSENSQVKKMNPENLTLNDGIILIHIMRQKANEINTIFNISFWTPRKIDMILWAVR